LQVVASSNYVLYNFIEVIKMSRGLKNRTPISNAVDTKLWIKFQQLSKETRIPQSRLLDEAIELLLEKYSKPTEK
jgi:hypothetical protein